MTRNTSDGRGSSWFTDQLLLLILVVPHMTVKPGLADSALALRHRLPIDDRRHLGERLAEGVDRLRELPLVLLGETRRRARGVTDLGFPLPAPSG
jgi:hypothetical protein